MDDQTELYLQRAENEMIAAQILFEISANEDMQKITFKLEREFTFYSATISHSYYCIFFCAKAILLKNRIETKAPGVHMKTLDAFDNHLVKTGELDATLLNIYRKMLIRAEELLYIFAKEKEKRARFTYQKLPQANREPAHESLANAFFFFKHINKMVRKE